MSQKERRSLSSISSPLNILIFTLAIQSNTANAKGVVGYRCEAAVSNACEVNCTAATVETKTNFRLAKRTLEFCLVDTDGQLCFEGTFSKLPASSSADNMLLLSLSVKIPIPTEKTASRVRSMLSRANSDGASPTFRTPNQVTLSGIVKISPQSGATKAQHALSYASNWDEFGDPVTNHAGGYCTAY